MQQILNVLLGGAEASKGASVGAPSQGADALPDGADFKSIIAKTNAYAEPPVKNNAGTKQKLVDDNAALTPELSNETQPDSDLSGMPSVLAQIQFSKQFSSEGDLAADGELLPLTEEAFLAAMQALLQASGNEVTPENAETEFSARLSDALAGLSVTGEGEDTIATEDMFSLFSTLMKGADTETREKLAELLGVSPEELNKLDGEAFAALLQSSPELKLALQIFTGLAQQQPVTAETQVNKHSENGVSALAVQSQHSDAQAKVLVALVQRAQTLEGKAAELQRHPVATGGAVNLEGDEQQSSFDNSSGVFKLRAPDKGPAELTAMGKGLLQADLSPKPGIVPLGVAKAEVSDDGSEQPKVKTDVASAVKEALALQVGSGEFKAVSAEQRLTGIERSLEAAGQQDTPAAQSFESRLATQRNELAQVQLSLRQGGERPLTQSDMVARFAPVMNAQLIAMVKDGVQQAEIRLDPPELGSMMVRIQVQGSETQVQFHVATQQTRDVVEQALPRLRELLAQQGMELTDGQVSQDRRGERQGGDQQDDAKQHFAGVMDEIPAEELQLRVNQTTSYASGIDYYA